MVTSTLSVYTHWGVVWTMRFTVTLIIMYTVGYWNYVQSLIQLSEYWQINFFSEGFLPEVLQIKHFFLEIKICKILMQ